MVNPRPEDTRQAILQAAIGEFALEGESGARTEAIARAAGVNKALIHYYFGTKEALYEAVLDQVFTGLVEAYLRVLQGPGTAGERLLRHFLAHFDRLSASGAFTRLMGHEMMRARRGESSRIAHIVRIAFGPLQGVLEATLAEGVASGELRPQDPEASLLSLTGANTFYFISAPFFQEITGRSPRDAARLERQRVALLDMAATVLFARPEEGRALAVGIHSESPGLPAPFPGVRP